MGVGSEYAAEEVEENKPQVPEPVFNVIAEYPEVEHIARDMQKSAMHEHRSKQGEHYRNRLLRMEAEEVFRYSTVCVNKVLAVSCGEKFKDEDRYI